jgi:hypothetical protein
MRKFGYPKANGYPTGAKDRREEPRETGKGIIRHMPYRNTWEGRLLTRI